MFEGINKYTLELAIDQEKIKHGLDPDISGSDQDVYKHGSRTFMDRESAKNWIKNQKISPDKLMKEIGYERNLSAKKGEISPPEDLFKLYENYYHENLSIRQETWKANANIRKNTIGKLIEKTQQ